MALNDELLSRINLTCCVLQMGQGRELKYASAGHPEGLLITADGSKPIAQSGIIPGVIPNALIRLRLFPLKAVESRFSRMDSLNLVDTSSRKALKELMLSIAKDHTLRCAALWMKCCINLINLHKSDH